MKYTINQFELDTNNRTLQRDSQIQAIRPKTLALLLYFLDNLDRVIDKQELLDNVWQDVAVNEGVVFQSIREIRQLFATNNIIQNHPRKGYQLIATVNPVAESPPPCAKKTTNRQFKWLGLAISMIGILTIGTLMWPWTNAENTLEDNDLNNRILVIPVTHQLDLGENHWLKLGGMELLIAKLSQMSDSHYVYSSGSTLQTIQISNISNKVSQFERNKLFALSGATHILETQVIGSVFDYSILFTLHSTTDSYTEIIPSADIIDGLSAVASSVAAQLNVKLESTMQIPTEFTDPEYIEAITVYEKDWASAIGKFEAYLESNPDSLLALRYLTKLYLWSGQISLAENLLSRALVLAKRKESELVHVLFNQALLARVNGQFENAIELLGIAEQRASEQSEWLLKSRIAETLGHLAVDLGEFDNAIDHFQQALSFNRLIQSPIGIATLELYLCGVYLQRSDVPHALTFFDSAKQRIEQQNLLFLYSMLADYEQQVIRATALSDQ